MTSVSRYSATATLAIALALPPGGPWLGADKVKHFLMSALIQSAAFSIGRAGGLERRDSNRAAALTTAVVGVCKEIHDKRVGKPFSLADLAWDAAGGASMAALLNRTR